MGKLTSGPKKNYVQVEITSRVPSKRCRFDILPGQHGLRYIHAFRGNWVNPLKKSKKWSFVMVWLQRFVMRSEKSNLFSQFKMIKKWERGTKEEQKINCGHLQITIMTHVQGFFSIKGGQLIELLWKLLNVITVNVIGHFLYSHCTGLIY